MRCWYAERVLGAEVWGTEKGEETLFLDAQRNVTMKGVDFIRDGFGVARNGKAAANTTLR